MSEKHTETYVKREHLYALCKKFDLIAYTAREASLGMFMQWRELYTEDFQVPNNTIPIEKFDIVSQVEMFNHDLEALNE